MPSKSLSGDNTSKAVQKSGKKNHGKGTKKYCYNEKDSLKVIEYLQKNPTPQRTLTLARHCQYSTAKPINPTLYALKRSGQLKQTDIQPPAWTLPCFLNDTEPPSNNVNTTQRGMIHAQKPFSGGRGILGNPPPFEYRTEFGRGRGSRILITAEERGRKVREWNPKRMGPSSMPVASRGRGGGFQMGNYLGRNNARPILGNGDFGQDDNYSRFADNSNSNDFFSEFDPNPPWSKASVMGDSFLDKARPSNFDLRGKRGTAVNQPTSVQRTYIRRDESSASSFQPRSGQPRSGQPRSGQRSCDMYGLGYGSGYAEKPISSAGQDSRFKHTSLDQSAPGAYRSSQGNNECKRDIPSHVRLVNTTSDSAPGAYDHSPSSTSLAEEESAPGAYKKNTQKMEPQEGSNKQKSSQECNFPPALAALMPSGHPDVPSSNQSGMNSYGQNNRQEVHPASENFVELESRLLAVLASSSRQTVDFDTLMTHLGMSRSTLEDILAECQQEDLLEVNFPNEVRLTSKGMHRNSKSGDGEENWNDSDVEDWDGTLHSGKYDDISDNAIINNEDDLSIRIQDVCNLVDVDEFNLISGLEYESITDDSLENWQGDADYEFVNDVKEDQGCEREQTLDATNVCEPIGPEQNVDDKCSYSSADVVDIKTDVVGEELELKLLKTLNASPGQTLAIKQLKEILAIPWSSLEDVLAEGQQEDFLVVESSNDVRLTVEGQKHLQNFDMSKLSETRNANVVGPPPFPAEIVQTKAMSTVANFNVDSPPPTPAQIIQSKSMSSSNLRNYTVNSSKVTKTTTSLIDLPSLLNLEVSTKCSSIQLPPSCVPVPNPGLKSASESKVQTPNNSYVSTTKVAETSRAFPDHHALRGGLHQQKIRDSSLDFPGKEYLILANRESVQYQLGASKSSGFSAGTLSGTNLGTIKRPPLLSNPNSVNLNPPGFLNRSSAEKAPLLPNPYSKKAWVTSEPSQAYQLGGGESTPSKLEITSESFAALNKNPISALMEYAQSRQIPARIDVLSQSGPPHKPTFLVAAVVGNRQFPGVSHSNKKDGRKDAAEQAIRILIAEGQYHLPSQVGLLRLPESQMTLFDKMAALTHHRFNGLIASIPETLTGRKVIAGMVMKVDEMDKGTVIAIGSGNRCVTGDKLSLHGHTVNDCHAEIITRRGFMRFLYRQLQTYKESCDHPLFEPSPMSGKLRLKESVSFHLYISTAPCGDGALFSPRDVKSNNGPASEEYRRHRPTMGGQSQGLLRTKMEGGEGTIPINSSDGYQTWDGILRGERLRTMSCSDKICRWNVVGMQGALLSHFLDPVYMGSLTLGYLYDQGHLSRAVCCRLDRGDPALEDDLPSSYKLHHPLLGRVTACDPPRETQKTKSYSVNWAYGDERPEVLEGSTGRLPSGESSRSESRLCKSELYSMFKATCHHLSKEKLVQNPNYLQAKRRSQNFLFAKLALCEKFEELGYGKWVFKPEEEKVFSWCLSLITETKDGIGQSQRSEIT